MKKLVLLSLSMFLLCMQLLAQNRTVTGKVTDSIGLGIPNVSVTIKGSKSGTTTDAGGNFTLTAPANASTLVISSVGYQDQEVAISESTMTISLTNLNRALNEVVVTAYGTTQKRAFTGTASTISNDKFKDLQVSTITGVLQGQASGVLSVSSNGQPGESPTIRVRGIGSVNASSDPLILLDGAPYGGNVNNINPNDVESITVLKDASSTALYGSRAANGIISITTKIGKGSPKVSVSFLNGWSDRAVGDYSYVNATQLYELSWEALRNQALITPNLITSTGSASAEEYASKTVAGTLVYNPFGVAQPVGTNGKLVANAKHLWEEDWTKALLQTGTRKDYNLSVSGGVDRSRYYLSAGYLDDQGIAIESRFKRYNARFKVDNKVNDWLTAGINTSVTYSTQNYPLQGGSAFSNVIGWIRGASSIFPVYLVDPATGAFLLDASGNKQYDFGNNGPLRRPYGTSTNPAATTSMNPTSYDRLITSVNAHLDAQLAKGLIFKTQYAVDLNQIGQNTYYNPFVGDGAAYGGRSFKSRDNQTTQTFTNTLTYDKTFGENHLNFLVGMEAYKYHESYVGAEARGFTFPNAIELSYGSTPYSATSQSFDSRMASYFSRLNYDLKDKYHLSLSLRRDGSSRFADSVRWGTFYSVGGAWNIGKEDFFSGVRTISDLKLRASYGTTGNQFLSSYFPYLGSYVAGANVAGYAGSIINTPTNGNLTWETQKEMDLGIDFGVLKNRISGSFTYFERTSSNLLFKRPLPPSSGFPAGIDDNIGQVRNRGIEIELTTQNVKGKDFTWTTFVNLTKIENEILKLPQASLLSGSFNNLVVGQSLYNFYIREYAGVDPADGRPIWYMDKKDANNKTFKDTTHTYSLATRYFDGTSLPKWAGGITNTFRYKGFDLNILISFAFGSKIYDADYAGLMYGSVGTQPGNNWTTDILRRWQKAGDITDVPKLTTTTDLSANSSSTRFLYDGSYGRIRNITLGYQFASSVLSRAHLNTARFFIDWQNPFTFFGRKGLDPEAGLSGVTSNTSSVYRTMSVGVNLDF